MGVGIAVRSQPLPAHSWLCQGRVGLFFLGILPFSHPQQAARGGFSILTMG